MNKQMIRERIWKMLEEENIAIFPRPCYGRIPNFVGSDVASEKIKELDEFKTARCVFCAPDYVLKRIREIVLEEGKVLAVALPHMEGFLEITPRGLNVNYKITFPRMKVSIGKDKFEKIKEAATINGFKKYGKPLKTKIDLFVQGSVAVDLKGNRLGKGTGYGDKEWEYMIRNNLIMDNIPVVTIVHEKQIVSDMSSLMSPTDKQVNYIITPERVIKVKNQ